uniref:C-type lectin domain-containing protein n=1 Tax=Panagrolaimus sp. PS1159 TaxID=55785 RepID=A0AC35GHY0_9BILA
MYSSFLFLLLKLADHPDVDPSKYITSQKVFPKQALSLLDKTTKGELEREERQIPMVLPFSGLSGLQGLGGGGFAGLSSVTRSIVPKVKYTVKSGPNGVSHIINDSGDYKNKGSYKGILCEFSSVEKCPEGYELFRHSCYKYFDEKADFPEAKSACEQKEGWLPKIRDDEINRYIACKAVKAKNAVMMTDIQRENSKWFGYWEDTNESAKHSYICAVKPTIGTPNLELIPEYSDAFKA